MASLGYEPWLEKMQGLRENLNTALEKQEPLLLVFSTFLTTLALVVVVDIIGTLVREVQDKGPVRVAVKVVLFLLRLVPGVQAQINKEKAKVVEKLQSSFKKSSVGLRQLPKNGLGEAALTRMEMVKAGDKPWQGRCSGTVYLGGPLYDKHASILSRAYAMFAHTNPLHPDIFPSVVRFESEVVAMTASLLGADEPASGGQVCGNMTTGGTESILMAVKASRDYMLATRGITRPEMVIAESAHSAYDKAAHYLGIRLRRASVGRDFRADVDAMRSLMSGNTILIVGSAPGYPHGVIDPIEELGQLALKWGACFHVDLCLGGFVLPFARKLGYPIPPFDFQVPGVTSISSDVHKYGFGPKGTSVVLFRNHEIRRHQFMAVTEWTGGLYVSPSLPGSRPGALLAAAWAALVSLGEDGYLAATKKMMEASRRLKDGIAGINGLYVVGEPDMTVIAFASNEVDVFKVNDVLTSKGWHLNALQKPASVHMCITLQHVDVIEQLLSDIGEAVAVVRANPGAFEDGMAPIYGAAAKMPDRGTISDLLVAYMDASC